MALFICYHAMGDRKRLAKSKYSAKFPIRFTRDFTNTDRKIKNA